MRTISEDFIQDLKGGCLTYFLEQVKKNYQELCLEIRNGYINIYYRGGNLLKIKQMKNGYRFHFDSKYCLHKEGETNHELLKSLNPDSAQDYIDNFETMKGEMDSWFKKYRKKEREFQHKLLVNNPNIIDIEYAPPKSKKTGEKLDIRIDMLMVDGEKLIIVENKYGIGAISGDAGLRDHYDGICRLLSSEALYDEMISSVKEISRIKYDLGLANTSINDIDKSKTEILFLLADYNEESTTLKNELLAVGLEYPVKILKMSSEECLIDLSKIQNI